MAGKTITRTLVDRIKKLVGYGLSEGEGDRGRGTMCVQACVQAALEEEHNDNPACVPGNRKNFGITLNDLAGWDDDLARGKGLKRYAIAQLGTSTKPEADFDRLVVTQMYEKRFHLLLKEAGADDEDVAAARHVRSKESAEKLIDRMRARAEKKDEELPLEIEGLIDEAPEPDYAWETIFEYFYPSDWNNDRSNADCCEIAEIGVQACIRMRTEGSQWLERYEELKGAERDKFIKQEMKKGEIQEEQARRAFAAKAGGEMRSFLHHAVDNNPDGLSLDDVLEELKHR